MDHNAFADPLSGSGSDSDSEDSYNEREQLPMVVASKSGDVDALSQRLAHVPLHSQRLSSILSAVHALSVPRDPFPAHVDPADGRVLSRAQRRYAGLARDA